MRKRRTQNRGQRKVKWWTTMAMALENRCFLALIFKGRKVAAEKRVLLQKSGQVAQSTATIASWESGSL